MRFSPRRFIFIMAEPTSGRLAEIPADLLQIRICTPRVGSVQVQNVRF
jgi:hypothetical protein